MDLWQNRMPEKKHENHEFSFLLGNALKIKIFYFCV